MSYKQPLFLNISFDNQFRLNNVIQVNLEDTYVRRRRIPRKMSLADGVCETVVKKRRGSCLWNPVTQIMRRCPFLSEGEWGRWHPFLQAIINITNRCIECQKNIIGNSPNCFLFAFASFYEECRREVNDSSMMIVVMRELLWICTSDG